MYNLFAAGKIEREKKKKNSGPVKTFYVISEACSAKNQDVRSPVRAPIELQAAGSAIDALHPTRRPFVISQTSPSRYVMVDGPNPGFNTVAAKNRNSGNLFCSSFFGNF